MKMWNKLTNVYFLEFRRVVVGIFTSLEKAQNAIKGEESENYLITEIPLNVRVCDEDFTDHLGALHHWHWDSEDTMWTS